jgi:hypothetical protein
MNLPRAERDSTHHSLAIGARMTCPAGDWRADHRPLRSPLLSSVKSRRLATDRFGASSSSPACIDWSVNWRKAGERYSFIPALSSRGSMGTSVELVGTRLKVAAKLEMTPGRTCRAGFLRTATYLGVATVNRYRLRDRFGDRCVIDPGTNVQLARGTIVGQWPIGSAGREAGEPLQISHL